MGKQINPLLKPVYELLKDPKRWTKRTYARDCHGLPVFSRSPKAVKWCLLGAISICDNAASVENMLDVYIQSISSFSGVVDYNDSPNMTHEKILRLLENVSISNLE